MPDLKNSAGYYAKEGMDAIDLFIGQEGTLSVITEAEFGLAAKPPKIFACYVFFKREEDSWDYAAAARPRHPLSLEYFDSNSLTLLRPKGRAIPRGAAAAIFFEKEVLPGGGNDIIEQWEGLIRAHGASLDDTWVAMTGKDLDAFNELRHAVPEAINEIVRRRGMRKLSTDIAVPESAFVTMMRFYVDTLRGSDMEYAVFGHIGENHVHVNVIPRSEGELGAAEGICMAS